MTPQAGISIGELWDAEGRPWPIAAAGQPYSEYTMAAHARDLGFRRNRRTSEYEQGPCIICQTVCDRGQIGDDYRCEECEAARALREGKRVYRWGTEPPEGHRDWLELERIAHWCRMRDEARQRRMKRLRIRLPDEDDRYHDTREQR